MPVKVGLKTIEIWNESMEDEVRAYEQEPIKKGQIVFYGPSHFTRWSTKWGVRPLASDLLGKSGAECCINRGFGSSCSEHQLYFYHRMIKPLEPRVLVYKSHGNSESFGYSLEETWELAQRVIAYTLTDFPDATVYIVGAVRKRGIDDEELANRRKYDAMQREFAEKTPRCHFLDCLDHEPLTREDIYVEDGIHHNQKGYDAFRDFFRAALKDELCKY